MRYLFDIAMSKMKIVLKQNQFERLQEIQEKNQVNQILIESLGVDDYNDLGIEYIRDWVKKNDVKLPQPKVPISWLMKNYGDDIMLSLGMDTRRGFPSIGSIGKEALIKGFVEDPTIGREGTFTEKYGPALEKMSKLYLPEYLELDKIVEESPWDVSIIFTYDPDTLIRKGKVDEFKNFRRSLFETPLFKLLGLGKEMSKAHGGVDLVVKFYGKYDWANSVAPKLIKTIKTNLNKDGQIWQIRRGTDIFNWGYHPLTIYLHYNFRRNKNQEPFDKWVEELNKLLFDLGYESPDEVYTFSTKY